MATAGLSTSGQPLAIAPTPPDGIEAKSVPPPMTHTCRTCAMRKVKCDKAAPTCSTCRKAKLECLYQPLPPRRRKRRISGDLGPVEKLARYERILQQLGVLEAEEATASASIDTRETASAQDGEPIALRFIPWGHSQTSKTGKLLASQGKSRYIDSDLWRNIGDDDVHPVSDDEQEEETTSVASSYYADPLTAAFMCSAHQSLVRYHPAHATAMVLWQIHADNVEPLCKILHIPSVAAMVEAVSQRPETASKTHECLLFTIYHFAVFSMTEDECVAMLGQPRALLRQQYYFAARQALVNASFLKTTDMSVLQALVLFLMASRPFYDPHTFWILTGVAVRIAQRMGIHRDGERLGLPPFEVQMRRRLFYQLLPLDAKASQVSGVGLMMPPDTWDTQPALNIDDHQIWPSMTEPPQERKGATEMIFCLSRFCIGKSIAGAGKQGNGTLSREFNDYREADRVISEAESEVEDKYIRYCDVINPLHFLAIGLARSGITAMRLRIRLPRARNDTATDAERREVMQLAQKIMDTDSAAHDHAGLMKRFRWYVSVFFLWGMWDSLVYVLKTLWTRPDLLSAAETSAAWDRMERVYQNHEELLDIKRALHVAFQRLTVKAWDASHESSQDRTEPVFIRTLRSLRRGKRVDGERASYLPAGGPGACEASVTSVGNLDIDLSGFDTVDSDFNLDLVDWTFWDRLIESDKVAQPDDEL